MFRPMISAISYPPLTVFFRLAALGRVRDNFPNSRNI